MIFINNYAFQVLLQFMKIAEIWLKKIDDFGIIET